MNGMPDEDEDTTLGDILNRGMAQATELALQSLDEMSTYVAKTREAIEAGRYMEAVAWIGSLREVAEDADAIYMLAASERNKALEAVNE